MFKPHIRYLLFVILSIFFLQAQAEITSLGSAINKAGRQRMLSQKILKDYALLGSGVDTLKAKQEMDQAIALFDQQLHELETYSKDKRLKNALKKVSALWIPYKKTVRQAPTKEQALQLLDDSDDVLRAAHKVVTILEDLSNNPAGHFVNIAGRQRMLSQRLSKLYIYQSWGFNNASIRSQMDQARNEFIGALQEMKSSPVNTAEINRMLKKASSEWKLFKHGLDGVEKRPIPYIVNLAGLKLLKSMNTITHLYEQLENTR
jgi:nitrate/nitrite-specific signal transduction histidine kinase